MNDVAIDFRVFRRHWAAIWSRLTEAELTDTTELVAQSLGVLEARDQAPARPSHAALMRRRAFTPPASRSRVRN